MSRDIYILCLSLFAEKSKLQHYFYNSIDGKPSRLSGIFTNEAPLFRVMEELALNDNQLDSIIIICSEQVLNKNNVPWDDVTKEYFLGLGINDFSISPYDYFIKSYNKYCSEIDTNYDFNKTNIKIVDLDKNYSDIGIVKTMIDEGKIISNIEDEGLNIYIDYNGGPRYVALMELALSNLLKIRKNIKIKSFAMNYNVRSTIDNYDCIEIGEFDAIFNIFELIAGVNEFVNYGRSHGLIKFFKSSKNRELHRLLRSMQEFAENLSLSRTDYILSNSRKLFRSMNEYRNKYSENPRDAYEMLFCYILTDIIKDFQSLETENLLLIIEWCLKKEFIQQALTFITEQIPEYLWTKKILFPSLTEFEEFKFSLISGEISKQNKINNRIDNIGYYSKYAYKWLINYYTNSSSINWRHKSDHFLYKKKGNYEAFGKAKNCLVRISSKDSFNIPQDYFEKPIKQSSKILSIQDRWQSNLKFKDVAQILLYYFLLKSIRNEANHASGSQESISYTTIVDLISSFIKMIQIAESNMNKKEK